MLSCTQCFSLGRILSVEKSYVHEEMNYSSVILVVSRHSGYISRLSLNSFVKKKSRATEGERMIVDSTVQYLQ